MYEKPLAGKKIAMMVANGFDEIEFTKPQKHLIEAGAAVQVVSSANGLVNGWYDGGWGHFFPVDADLASTLAVDYDGLIVPGGARSVDKMAEEPHACRVLKAFLREDMPVLMLGAAVSLMVATEDAAGRAVAADPELREALVAAGADCPDDPVAVSDNLATCADQDAIERAIGEFVQLVLRHEGAVNEAA